MNHKAIANETLAIMEQGYYYLNDEKIDIKEQQQACIEKTILLSPEQGEQVLKNYNTPAKSASHNTEIMVWDCSTVEAILTLSKMDKKPSVLNFASAKNPGGGFIGGAMAQEESLATSSCLYYSLLSKEDYYKNNRACRSMMYTDHAIYSPDVVFFRDGKFQLHKPTLASVLTLPAVNMGQVLLKGEDKTKAEQIMKRRMKLALAIFADQGCQHLILGAYGCGVFRNDPSQIAAWWKEHITEYFSDTFKTIIFAILDRSKTQNCLKTFQNYFPEPEI